MRNIPSIHTDSALIDFRNAVLNVGLPAMRPEVQEIAAARDKGEPEFRLESIGFYAGLAMAELDAIYEQEEAITKEDIKQVFERLEEDWLNTEAGIPPKMACNLIAIELMFKKQFDNVLGLGRSKQ